MTGVSPWSAPPETGPQQAPVYPPPPASVPPQSGPPIPPVAPPPRPPRRRFSWLIIGGAVVMLIAVIAATAAVTYALARNTDAPNATAPTASPTSPQFSASDQAAAKQAVCQVFDVSVRGQQDQGGVRINGQPNLSLMLRTLNSVVAVQNALIPALPEDVATAARRYINANLQLTTATTGVTPIEEVNRLNTAANDATFAFADACGLQR
jgi:hypothetical protein